MVVHQVEAARALSLSLTKPDSPRRMVCQGRPSAPGGGHGGHDVLDLEPILPPV